MIQGGFSRATRARGRERGRGAGRNEGKVTKETEATERYAADRLGIREYNSKRG